MNQNKQKKRSIFNEHEVEIWFVVATRILWILELMEDSGRYLVCLPENISL